MIKAVFFDCDGILLFGNPWEKLRIKVNLSDELDRQWADDYYEGRATFETWMERVRNFYIQAGLDKDGVDEAFSFDPKELNPQAAPLIDYIKEKGLGIAVVSSGADEYVSKVAAYYGIERFFTNTVFNYDQDNKFVRIDTFGEDPQVKIDNINKFCSESGIDPKDTIFIGDSSNDQGAFKVTQHGILYRIDRRDKPELEKLAWKRVNDLREVIKIIEDENANSN